jgi:hypothetical protein
VAKAQKSFARLSSNAITSIHLVVVVLKYRRHVFKKFKTVVFAEEDKTISVDSILTARIINQRLAVASISVSLSKAIVSADNKLKWCVTRTHFVQIHRHLADSVSKSAHKAHPIVFAELHQKYSVLQASIALTFFLVKEFVSANLRKIAHKIFHPVVYVEVELLKLARLISIALTSRQLLEIAFQTAVIILIRVVYVEQFLNRFVIKTSFVLMSQLILVNVRKPVKMRLYLIAFVELKIRFIAQLLKNAMIV